MKTLVGVASVVALFVMFPLVAGASGPWSYATGSGERPQVGMFGARHISFSALDGPEGPSGHVRSHDSPFNDFSGHVTCLLVDGNRAVVGGVMEQAALEERVGSTFMFAVEDNGTPAEAPDRLSVTFFDAPEVFDPTDCTVGTALYATLVPITSGNFTVYQAP